MLAFALANRQSKALSLLLKAVARVPPRARVPLVEAPAGVPPFLPYLAQQYPKLVADFEKADRRSSAPEPAGARAAQSSAAPCAVGRYCAVVKFAHSGISQPGGEDAGWSTKSFDVM